MPGITPSRWLPLVVVMVLLPFLHATKIQKISETTKYLCKFFHIILSIIKYQANQPRRHCAYFEILRHYSTPQSPHQNTIK
jgi:hypothetical protein